MAALICVCLNPYARIEGRSKRAFVRRVGREYVRGNLAPKIEPSFREHRTRCSMSGNGQAVHENQCRLGALSWPPPASAIRQFKFKIESATTVAKRFQKSVVRKPKETARSMQDPIVAIGLYRFQMAGKGRRTSVFPHVPRRPSVEPSLSRYTPEVKKRCRRHR